MVTRSILRPVLRPVTRAVSDTIRGFNPRSLFASGEQGIWLDPSDFSTLFQDAAGTTPVTAVGQQVGLALDKRLGLALGSELATNGGFDSNITGWNLGASTSASWAAGQAQVTFGGQLTVSLNNCFYLPTPGGYVAGRRYEISFDATYISGGNLQCGTGYAIAKTITAGDNGGVKKRYTCQSSSGNSVAAGTAMFGASSAGSVWLLDNISVREIAGNHASASGPKVEARVNLIIASSENIGGAGWALPTGNTYTHNSVIVDGIGLTLVVPTVTSNNKSTYTSSAASTGIPNRVISAYCKPAGYRYIHISESGSGVLGLLVFDSQTGTFTQNSLGLTVSAVSIGSGVYKFSIVASSTANISPAFSASPTSTAAGVYGSTFAGDGVSGVYIGGIEIRNPADSAYPYQKVNTATDYVDVGAPRYLSFDGTDDGMATPSINFTGTDKMTVWAGVRKLSDAAGGIVCELSATSGTNNGAFGLAGPATVAANYSFLSKGTTLGLAQTGAVFASPNSSVLTGIGSISGDSAILRINGVQAAAGASDQGTGNYGNYPLYIGRRGGTSSPFNGRIYQLIVRGAESNAGQITAGEAWCNSKTRAY